jgi:SEL1 protein
MTVLQWARNRRQAESEREGDFGPEDYFEGAVRGGHRGEEESDQFTETMLLVGLCVLVSVLLYIRGRWVERLQREQQQQQQPQPLRNGAPIQPPAGGLYPPPRDPPREQ